LRRFSAIHAHAHVSKNSDRAPVSSLVHLLRFGSAGGVVRRHSSGKRGRQSSAGAGGWACNGSIRGAHCICKYLHNGLPSLVWHPSRGLTAPIIWRIRRGRTHPDCRQPAYGRKK
jgi:hypothetical protein